MSSSCSPSRMAIKTWRAGPVDLALALTSTPVSSPTFAKVGWPGAGLGLPKARQTRVSLQSKVA